MDRPKRAASKVGNYRHFHLSGDLNTSLQGKVDSVVDQFEALNMSQEAIPEGATAEQLREMLEKSKASSAELEAEAEIMKLRNELEAQAMRAQQWELAMASLKESRDKMTEEHGKQIEEIKKITEEGHKQARAGATDWLKTQLHQLTTPDTGEDEKNRLIEEDRKKQEEKNRLIDEIKKQQEQLASQLADLTGEKPTPPKETSLNTQSSLMEQLRAALTGQKPEDPNRILVKALANTQNRVGDSSGANTLKPELMGKLLGENNTTMQDWLANLNKQEEGEFDFSNPAFRCDTEGGECRHTKQKSGMLDKPTSTVVQKQIWPQKNLGEDWAEDEVDFKHLKFEHMVAGETRTIETCTEPAQILGRLRLLRRIAYLKLRGYEWYLLRRMYAAILRSIETREYSWDSNFDRFETILYRRAMNQEVTRTTQDNRGEPNNRKRFCRDYNKPEGCPKHSPHNVWMGTGPSATKKLVHHVCAACIIKDKQSREHPEGHPDCPHKD